MDRKEIGAKLKALRIKANLERKEVSAALGVSVKLIGHWETGYSEPNIEMFANLLRLYKGDANKFYGIDDDEEVITNEDKRLLVAYHNLPDDLRAAVNKIVKD